MLDKINQDLIKALKAKEELRVLVLRSIKTAINNEAIAMKKKDEGISEEESIAVLKREAKKRKDAAQAYQDGGRQEQYQQELKELAIIEEYLPAQMGEDQVGQIIDEAIKELGTVTVQDFGKVMGVAMKKIGAQADGNVVSKLVKEKLS